MALANCRHMFRPKLVYAALMRPKIRPKHMSAVSQRHVKNLLFIYLYSTLWKVSRLFAQVRSLEISKLLSRLRSHGELNMEFLFKQLRSGI